MRGLTQRDVNRLKPPERGSAIIWDGVIPGFGVRVTEKGVKSYILAYRIGGKQTKFVIGRADEWNVDEARDEAIELRRDVREGIDPQAQLREQREKMAAEPTVKELSEKYYDEHVIKMNGEDQQRNARDLLKIVVAKWGKRKVSAVKRADAKTLHNSMSATKYRANRLLSVVSKMYTFGMEQNPPLCSHNPAKGVKKFPEDKRQVWMTPEQLEVLDAGITEYGTDSADLVRLLLLTGYRRREWMRAKKASFDMAHATWTKLSHAVKNRKWVQVRLSEAVMVVLRRVMASTPASEPYLFPGKPKLDGKSARKPRTTIRRVWEQILRRASLVQEYEITSKAGNVLKRYRPTVRLHDLRHSYASWLAEQGVPLPVIGKALGHMDPATTSRYSHIADKSAQNAQEMFGNMVTQGVQ
jgi:integrase